MPFVLPPLPYAYTALEPYIDAKTMEIHYTMHHAAYINNLNQALQGFPALANQSIEEILLNLDAIPEPTRTVVRNNGGGHYNHSFFWKVMKPGGGGEPKGIIAEKIKEDFGSFAKFQEEFNAAAKKVFGSGWAWLCVDPRGKFLVVSTPNQDSPILSGLHPILGLDVWEHAYYLKYQNKRPSYIDEWWHVVNWEQVEKNYTQKMS